jgi:hypothetical protein
MCAWLSAEVNGWLGQCEACVKSFTFRNAQQSYTVSLLSDTEAQRTGRGGQGYGSERGGWESQRSGWSGQGGQGTYDQGGYGSRGSQGMYGGGQSSYGQGQQGYGQGPQGA